MWQPAGPKIVQKPLENKGVLKRPPKVGPGLGTPRLEVWPRRRWRSDANFRSTMKLPWRQRGLTPSPGRPADSLAQSSVPKGAPTASYAVSTAPERLAREREDSEAAAAAPLVLTMHFFGVAHIFCAYYYATPMAPQNFPACSSGSPVQHSGRQRALTALWQSHTPQFLPI